MSAFKFIFDSGYLLFAIVAKDHTFKTSMQKGGEGGLEIIFSGRHKQMTPITAV